MSNSAILLAGGSGSRMRGSVKDKVLENLCGLPVILHSFKAFIESGCVAEVVFVCRDDIQIGELQAAVKKYFPTCCVPTMFTYGGAERQDSVLNGLEKVSDPDGLAFIHDGARPMLGVENVRKLCEAASKDGAAVLASKVVDTIKRVPSGAQISKCMLEDLDRKTLWAMQTPQVFKTCDILNAYRKIKENKTSITDDVAAAIKAGIGVSIVENLSPNPKITVPEDIAYIEFLSEKISKKDNK